MAEAALSEWIAPDKIFSRDQFYFNDPVDLLGEGGFSQVFKALLKRDPRREWMKGDLFVAAKVLIGRRNNWSRIDQRYIRAYVTLVSTLRNTDFFHLQPVALLTQGGSYFIVLRRSQERCSTDRYLSRAILLRTSIRVRPWRKFEPLCFIPC
jgi:hypothetical protein